MAQFMLLLHEAPTDFSSMSPAEIQAVIGEYSAWRDQIQERGVLVGSNKLADEPGRHMTQGDNGLRVVDGPWSETKELLGGYFIIEANDYDAAVDISKGCPHLKFGGRIELRQVDLMHEE